jgi:pyruvate dehydrogenase E1 component
LSAAQPSMPRGVEEGIIKGMYRVESRGTSSTTLRVRLLGSGAILREVIGAADHLLEDFGIASDIFSVTSFSELARDARAVERHNRYHPMESPRVSHLELCLAGDAPIIAASDYVRAYPQLIASHLGARYLALGTDGFGRSDTRSALRDFFEVDRRHVAIAALSALVQQGRLGRDMLQTAIARYKIDVERPAPWTV